jgi:hypothetical protein
MEGSMKNLIGMAVGLCLLISPATTQTAKVHKDCVNLTIFNADVFPIGHDLENSFRRELDRRLFWSNMYISSTRDVLPALNVEITMEIIDGEAHEGEDPPERAVVSVAYVLFPHSIRYHAYSTCGLLDRERLESVVRGIEKDIVGVYDLAYHKAEDLKKIYDAHIKAEEAKLEKLKKKGESE